MRIIMCKMLNAPVLGTAPQGENVEKDGSKKMLPEELTVTIDGVIYHVHSVFAEEKQMDELLDLATMENIRRCA